MSFGFSVGDFITVGQLAFRVYQDVYMIAKNAPAAIKKLRDELAILSGAINILISEIEIPTSLVNNAGEMRKKMVIELIKNILSTLAELEELSGKHAGMSNEEVSKARQIWARVKWTKDARSMTTLLAKVEHYNSILNLLVASVGNSSLERIESTNRSMAQQLSELAELLAATSIESRQTFTAPVKHGDASTVMPVVTIVKERFLQLSLSEKLMKNAERSRPWVLIGLDLWLQAGRWWLMKAQSSLHPFGSQKFEIGVQAYADLIKAYWIIVDIIAEHPQQKYLHGGSQRLETQLLIETVKSELQKIQKLGLRPPMLSDVESADLEIWIDLPAGLDLKPKTASLADSDHRLWSTPNEDIYFQRIGTYLPGKPRSLEPRSEGLCSACLPAIILFLVDRTKRAARIVVQSQNMVNLLTLPMKYYGYFEPEIKNLNNEGRYCLKHGEECFFFTTVHECYLLQAFIEGFQIYAFYCSDALANPVSLEAFIMLAAIKNEEKSVVEFLLQNLASLRSSSTDDINVTDILSLSRQVANRFLQTPLGPQISFHRNWEIRKIPDPDRERNIAMWEAMPLDGPDLNWQYRLIKAPANCMDGSWIDIFIKEGLDFRSSPDSPLNSAAAAGDLCALKALIIAGVDIDACYGKVTAISQAALNGQQGAIRLLHDQGANLVGGDTYCTFFDCALYDRTTARFCIDLPRFQINEPCGNVLTNENGRMRMTPIKVLISHYKPEIWATRMLCEAGAKLNEAGILSFVYKSTSSLEKPEERYKPYQSVLDRALERVGEEKAKKVEQITEKVFQMQKERMHLWNKQDEDKYKDRSHYNKWHCQVKERRVWAAEEVVRILQEFGAKLGESLPGYECIESPDSQHIAGLKRRRSDSQ